MNPLHSIDLSVSGKLLIASTAMSSMAPTSAIPAAAAFAAAAAAART